MYTRAQFILALAIVACSLCLVIAFPAADDDLNISNKVRNPRLGGSRISKQLGKRDEDTTFNIDLSGNDNNVASSAIAVASTASASAAPIASTSAAVIAATNAPTPIPTAAPTATTHYASSFVFTASLKDTNPLNDGLVKMASLREKGLKKSKKSSASVKSASKASKSAGKLTGTAAAAAAATSN
ncbi:hypothetical protein V8B55DRAFT_1547036 [Mucor lusitanicus]|uniref:Uncharacterized protein n=1 Tax=Mucor lusitanicus CBS 277.49 TaxID=747725 RepID=A0A168HHU3_MUCCL|nr:hypothetical protein MUCCIDRAFT_85349 [Mucor lusitanicus CBS 277.49]